MSPYDPRGLPPEPPAIDPATAPAAEPTPAAWRRLLDTIAEDLWRCTPDGRMTELVATSGAPEPHGVQTTAARMAQLHPDDRAAVQMAMEWALPRGEPFAVRARGRRNDGNYRWLELRAVAVRDDHGAIREWLGATIDVHEQHQAATRDQAMHDRLQLALTASRMGIWEWDLAAKRVHWSPECHAIFGLAEFDGTVATFEQLVHPDDRSVNAARLIQAVATGSDYASEFRVRRPDGEELWISNLARVLLGQDGKASRLVGTAQDVTERKRTEALARESQERLRVAIDTAPMSAWSVDPRTRQVEIIARSQSWTPGVHAEHFPLSLANANVHEDDRAMCNAAFERSFATGAPLDLTCRLRDPDGHARWTVSHGSVVRGQDGKPRLFGVTLDVSERMRTNEALRRSEARFAQAFHALPIGLCIAERDSAVFVDANPTFLAMIGRRREEVVGKSSIELGLWSDPSHRAALVSAATAGLRDAECRLESSTGEVRDVLYSAEIIEMNGHPCILSMVHDITARKQSEAALLQARKMEAVGRLAGGLAHDFNNLLSVLSSSCFLLPQQLAAGESTGETLEVLQQVLERGTGLTRQLLALSRQQVAAPALVDCNAHLQRSLQLMRHLLGEDIVLQVDLAAALPPIRIDPSQLEQIVLNLAANARDAMPGGGHLAIRTDLVQVAANDPRLGHELGAGPHIRIRVQDDGSGMSETAKTHAFEPFYTTKPFGKGTGLGLAVVHGIVRQSGGRVELDSELGRGTTVTIWLPAAAADATIDRSPVAPADTTHRGSERVLVVEDDDGVRRLVCSTLTMLGYDVLQARNGREAIDLFASAAGSIRLLLTDAIMPGMNGREVAEALRRQAPGLAVLYMSGYTDDRLLLRGVLAGREDFLHKPFSVAELSARVRSALETASRSEGSTS
ncbi:MAG: PAS domain-containing protein [Planctomycetes bacterium]|nr:PAS domain-containing protein [Planctomycetota bacterium]